MRIFPKQHFYHYHNGFLAALACAVKIFFALFSSSEDCLCRQSYVHIWVCKNILLYMYCAIRRYSMAGIIFLVICSSVNGLFFWFFFFACSKTANSSVLGLLFSQYCNISIYNVIYWLCGCGWVTIYVQTQAVEFLWLKSPGRQKKKLQNLWQSWQIV